MLSSNLSVNVESPDSLGRNSRRRQKFRHKLSEVLMPMWTTKAVLNLTLRINNLTTPLPSGLVKMLGHSLNAVMPPNRRLSPNPKMKFGRERDKQIQVISSNHNNKHTGHKIYPEVRQPHKGAPMSLLKWPQRSKSLSPPCLSQSNHKGHLRFPLRNHG